jgi:tetratricopeptide (TPR) repeat protein
MKSSMKSSKYRVVSIVIHLAVVCALASAAGCQAGKKKTPQQQAEQRWAASRAAVLGSLAKDQLESGQFDKCRETLDKAKRLDPTNAQFCILYARMAIEQGQLDVAERECAEARRLDPKNAEADYMSGVVYQRWLKPQVAFDYYTSAAEKDAREVGYPLAQAEMLVELGRQDEALSLLQSRLEDFGTSAVMYDTIGQLHVGRADYAQAVDALRQANTLASEDTQIREHLALAQFYNKQYREAHDGFVRVLKEPKNAERAELYIALGECQMNMGRTRDGRDSFDKATQVAPQSAPAWLCLTKAALELGDVRRAELTMRRALALAPEMPETQLMLGFVRLKQDKLPEAMAAFRKASSMDPKDPVSLCMIGYVLEKNGKPEQAAQYYGRALKVKPDDELAAKLMASVNE